MSRISDPGPDPLEELIFLALERRSSGEVRALDELCAAHPALAPALRARVAELEASGMLDEEGSPPDLPERFGEYRLVRRIGQGGMGVVYLAEEPRLGRRVALKVLRPEHVFFDQARERFRREARSVARLAHPGIVPLYASGESSGVPFFTMALVEGVSLADALRALEGRDPATLGGSDLAEVVARLTRERGYEAAAPSPDEHLFRGTWPEACAWLAREVAQALEHAHQRGVLHRDVKPSNVLVTPDGRVLLVDFGLASVQSVDRMTRSGAQLGSLPYMAPEQVAGDVARLDGRADVYGLGVLFYELLSLRLPFQEVEPTKLAARIGAGDAAPLRRAHRGLSADYETVCRTAMEVDPARRYPSPAHLARDLSNLLEGRSIEARPAGVLRLVARYAARRPAHATAAALGLVLAVGGPLTIAALESQAAGRVERERDAARANLDAALEAVEVLLERAGSSELREVPGLERLRGELLTRATDLYERLEATSGGDPRTRLRVGGAMGRLAKLRQETGDRQGALVGFAAAEERLAALARERPDDPRVLFEYGNLLAFASISRFPADPRAAVDALQPAISALRRSCELDPEAARPRSELARGLLALAHFQDGLDQDDEALAVYAEAEALARALVAEGEPGSAAWYDAFELEASAQGRTANIFVAKKDNPRADTLLQGIVSRSSELPKLSAYMRQLRSVSIQTLVGLRVEPEGAPRDTSLDELLAIGHDDALTLLRQFPGNMRYVSSAAHSFVALGKREARFDELAAARQHFEEGARIHRDLATRHPEDPTHWRNLGLASGRLADVDGREGLDAQRLAHHFAAMEAHSEAFARGMKVSADEAMTSARQLMERAAKDDDVAALDEVVAHLRGGLARSFVASVDAAQGEMLAVRILTLRNDVDALPTRRAAAAADLARALTLRPDLAHVVEEHVANHGLADEPAWRDRGRGAASGSIGDATHSKE